MRGIVTLLFFLWTGVACAEAVAPKKTIRPGEVISVADLENVPEPRNGVFAEMLDLVGQEARVVLYPGRPIRPSDVGPRSLVQRNQIVTLVFRQNGLQIRTEGRALARGSVGDIIRVMNLESRLTVSGRVDEQGAIEVQPR